MTDEAERRPKSRVPDGIFWVDHIKTLRDDPQARLEIARQHLPLPAAFREAAVALRAFVRSRRKKKEGAEDLLGELYRLAAQHSLLLDTAYIAGIGPGFNVAESIPRKTWERADMPYAKIGYEKLGLLNKTDARWLVEAWGEPKEHQAAQKYHAALWESAVKACKSKQAQQEVKIVRELRGAVGGGTREEAIRHFHTKVAGVTKKNPDGSNRQRILKACKAMEQVVLIHDSDSPYDENAIEVRRTNDQQVGFLPAHIAEEVAENLSRGYDYWAWIKEVTGGEGGKNRGANILILEARPETTVNRVEAYARERLGMKILGRGRGCAVALLMAAAVLIAVAVSVVSLT